MEWPAVGMMVNKAALAIMSTAFAGAVPPRRTGILGRSPRARCQRPTKAAALGEFQPQRDAVLGGTAIGVALERDGLVGQEPPREDIGHKAAEAIHRDLDPGRRKNAGEIGTNKPAALVGVENPGLPSRASASLSAATQNAAPIVFDSRHDKAARLASTDHETALRSARSPWSAPPNPLWPRDRAR